VLEKVVRRITADGHAEVTESDLANVDVIAFLYSALRFTPNPSTPEGHGEVTFHLEDGLLALNNFRYFNRGTEIRAIADIDSVWTMPDSPIDGIAVGTARPLRDVRLPFLSSYDLDAILTALQTDLTTVRIAGTVRNPQIIPLAFSDIGAGMRMLIVGDFEKEKRRPRRPGQ
jgi:hypothetical protein